MKWRLTTHLQITKPMLGWLMVSQDMSSSASLSMPWRRDELILYLKELSVADPRPLWRADRKRGLIADIDQVFHFFFDDNDFDDIAIGATLLNRSEVGAIRDVKSRLEAILDSVGDAGDDLFVEHPLWPKVTAAASNALRQLA
jgi:hypothetical protein